MIPNQDRLDQELSDLRKEKGDNYADAVCALCAVASFMKTLPKEVASDIRLAHIMVGVSRAFSNILQVSSAELSLQAIKLVGLAHEELK